MTYQIGKGSLMQDMTFTALIAIGSSQYGAAVLNVTSADADVRRLVIEDITEEGDRDFLDALGDGLPSNGLVSVHAELVGWPGEYDAPKYRLISATPVALPNEG